MFVILLPTRLRPSLLRRQRRRAALAPAFARPRIASCRSDTSGSGPANSCFFLPIGLCSCYVPKLTSPEPRAKGEAGMEAGMEHESGAGGQKRLAGLARRQVRRIVFGILGTRRTSSEGRRKEKNFCRPSGRKALINLESAPEMEGKGRKWKGVSRLHCAQLRCDRAWLRIGGAFLNEDCFDFAKAGDRQEAGVRCSGRATAGPRRRGDAEGRPASGTPRRSRPANGRVGWSAGNGAATH